MNKSKVIAVDKEYVTELDIDTGELKQSEKEIRVVRKNVSTKDFMQIYLEDLSGMFKLENKIEVKLMALLWRDCEFNQEDSNEGNKIYALKDNKEKWAKEVECSLSAVNNAISALAKKDLLIKKGRSVYMVNPKYFFKGFSKDQPKVMRTILEYKLKSDGK